MSTRLITDVEWELVQRLGDLTIASRELDRAIDQGHPEELVPMLRETIRRSRATFAWLNDFLEEPDA